MEGSETALRTIQPSRSLQTHQLPGTLTGVTHCVSALWPLTLQSNNIQLVASGSLYSLRTSVTA